MAATMIATREEIRAVYQRAADLLDTLDDEEDEIDDDEAERRAERQRGRWVALEGLRFCAVAASALRDPTLGDVVLGVIDLLEPYRRYTDDDNKVAGQALTTLLQAGLKVDRHVRELAGGEREVFRLAVALGLAPHGDAERALLEKLLHDPVTAVRQAAKKALEAVGETPWWTGKWKSDPGARLLPGEVETCGPALRRASELLDLPPHAFYNKDAGHLAELGALLAGLPDELALEAAELFCRAWERHNMDHVAPVLKAALERPGGAEMFDRLVEHWGRRRGAYVAHTTLVKIVLDTSREARLALCRRLIDRVTSAPWEDRRGVAESPAWLAGAIAGGAWPPEEDVTPVLDALLSLDPGEETGNILTDHDHAALQLAAALGLPGVDPTPVLDRIVEARVAGYPGAWRSFPARADALLARAPREVLRRTAERALESEDEHTVLWALHQLLGGCHDPEKDGPARERAATLATDPRLRAVILTSPDLTRRALPRLREELLGGGLTYRQAVHVFEVIASLYGGLAAIRHRREVPPTPAELEEDRREARAKIEPYLAPPATAGPPTEAEWAALLRARDAWTGDDLEERALLWMRTLSAGPWSAEERAVLDDYMAMFRAGHQGSLAFPLSQALADKPDVSLLPLLDEVARGSSPDDRSLVKDARARTYHTLGVPRPPLRGASKSEPAGETPGDDWGDGEDDDG